MPTIAAPTPVPTTASLFSSATPVYFNYGEAYTGVNGALSSVVGDASVIASPLAQIPYNANIDCNGKRPIDNLYTAYSMEDATTHFHVHLSIFVNGNQIAIPAGIGFIGSGLPGLYSVSANPNGFYAGGSSCTVALHTHTRAGIIHVEDFAAPNPVTGYPTETFTLGQFFDVWTTQISSVNSAVTPGEDPATFLGAILPNAVALTPTAYVTSNWYDTGVQPTVFAASQLSGIVLTPDEEITIVFGALPVGGLPRYNFDQSLCAKNGYGNPVCQPLSNGSPYP